MSWSKYGLRVEKAKLDSPRVQTFCITLLFLLWLIIQLIIFYHLGIRTGSDTQVYVDAAHKLLGGELPNGRLLWYSTYVAFLALVFTIGGGFQLVALLQIMLSGVAAVALWFSVRKMTESFWVSFIVVLLYLCWFKIHQWNIFIYTDSLFTSLSIITFAILLHLKRSYTYIIFVALFLLTFFVRPTGFCFMIGLMLYVLHKVEVHKKMKLVLGMVLLLSGLALLNDMLGQFTLIESYIRGEVIYPNITLNINVPHDLTIPDPRLTPLFRLGVFVFYNPLYFAKMSLLKLFLFLANVKPYFSFLHNIFIALILYPLYIFAFLGFKQFPTYTHGKYFILGFLLSQSLTVMLTTENWDGRFLIPVLPFVFILSGIGIRRVIKGGDKC